LLAGARPGPGILRAAMPFTERDCGSGRYWARTSDPHFGHRWTEAAKMAPSRMASGVPTGQCWTRMDSVVARRQPLCGRNVDERRLIGVDGNDAEHLLTAGAEKQTHRSYSRDAQLPGIESARQVVFAVGTQRDGHG